MDLSPVLCYSQVLMAKHNQYIYGFHAVESCLRKNPRDIKALWILMGRKDLRTQKLVQLAQQCKIKTLSLSITQLEQKLPTAANHQGVVACCYEPPCDQQKKSLDAWVHQVHASALLLILDGVQDPHNLGACLRTAAAAQADAVIVPKDHAVGLTPTVRKVACGAAECMPFFAVTNLVRCLNMIKSQGIWVLGTSEKATQSLYETDLTVPIALVLGNEQKGLRHLTQTYCDQLIAIPTAEQQKSLNVSVAAGISLFEAVRQRQRQHL